VNRIYLLDFKIVIGKPRQMQGLGALYKILEEAGASSTVVPINQGSPGPIERGPCWQVGLSKDRHR
jgi:hypothetical protein